MQSKIETLITKTIKQIKQKHIVINETYQKTASVKLNQNLRQFKSPVDTNTIDLVQASINDYLLFLRNHELDTYLKTIENEIVYQRSKNPQRAYNKVQRWQTKDHISLSKYLNDLRGYRLIIPRLRTNEQTIIQTVLEPLKEKGFLHRYYVKDALEKNGKNHYHAIHCYIQTNNHYFPWELQLWDAEDATNNYQEHSNYEQETRF